MRSFQFSKGVVSVLRDSFPVFGTCNSRLPLPAYSVPSTTSLQSSAVSQRDGSLSHPVRRVKQDCSTIAEKSAFRLPHWPFSPPPAGKTPFTPNYFHLCTCVKSVRTPSNSRIHNGLSGVETSFFDQKIVRTVRRRLFQTRATIAP
jgi:hypothetical protein